MAKKTRTELSTSAINTNLPDNTQELITPTTERAQLTDERESVINYKDDLGGTGNAGKFLTVATDGESLTMVDAPTGDVTGTGVAAQVTFWDGTSSITSDAMLVVDDTNKILKIIIPTENASGGISIDQQGTTGSGSLQFLDDGLYKAQIVYDVTNGNLTLNSNGDIEITPTGDTVISGGTPIVEHVRISSGGDVGIGISPSHKLDVSGTIHQGDGTVDTYFGLGSSNDNYISTNGGTTRFRNGGTVQLTISSGGNVGIGITSPTSYNSSGDDLVLGSTSNLSNGLSIVSPSSGDSRGNIYFADGTSVGSNTRGFITYKHSSDSMLFGTNDSLALTIASSGLVTLDSSIVLDDNEGLFWGATSGSNEYIVNNGSDLILGTGGSPKLTISSGGDVRIGRATTSTSRQLELFKQSGDTSDYYIICENVLQNKFLVSGTGTIYAVNTTVQSSSDARLKENIRVLDTGLNEILNLKPRRFDWKKDEGLNIKNDIGFVAQEVEEILPDLVMDYPKTNDDDIQYKSLGMSKMIPTLVKAIQEQQTIIQDLKSRIEKLEL